RVVEVAPGDSRRLLMSWTLPSGNRLVLAVPAEAIAPDLMPRQLAATGLALVSLAAGALIGTVPHLAKAPGTMRFGAETATAEAASATYPLVVRVLVPYATFERADAPLRRYAVIGGGL